MRKLLTLFLVLLFLTSMTYPVFGSDHRETALAYLTEKYSVPKEKIQLSEGGITEFEFTAESFWFAKYMIATEGKSLPGSSMGEKPTPVSEPIPPSAPDMPSDSKPAIMPTPAKSPIGGGYIDGGIYIRIKTGEILEMDKMEPFFSAESQLAQQEWERLRKEAGKLDVSLYRRLQGLPAAEKVSVSIQPTPVETDDLKAQFAALKKKYPELTSGMELSHILPSYGYDLPIIRDGGGSSSSGSAGYAVPEGDAAVSYAVPEPQVDPALPVEKTAPSILPIMPDEKYQQEYAAMWKQLEQICLQAVTPSLSTIKKTLDSMGITYENNGASIEADLTAEQINNIANLSAVSAVYEKADYVTMDAIAPQMARSNAPAEMMAASVEAKKDESSSSNLPLILIAGALLTGGALVMYRRRISRTR